MTSLIRNLKNERKTNKYRFKKEGDLLCTKEGTPTEPAIFTKMPMDIAVMKRYANAKLINTRLKKAQADYYEKHKGETGSEKIFPKSLTANWFMELAKRFNW